MPIVRKRKERRKRKRKRKRNREKKIRTKIDRKSVENGTFGFGINPRYDSGDAIILYESSLNSR